MSVTILFSWGGIFIQFKENQVLKDNDLKYRYIKMQGKANHDTLLELEADFTYNLFPVSKNK